MKEGVWDGILWDVVVGKVMLGAVCEVVKMG